MIFSKIRLRCRLTGSARLCTAASLLLAFAHSKSATAAEPATPTLHWPLMFEENKGQHDDAVRFTARSGKAQLFLTDDEAVIVLRSARDASRGSSA